MHIAKTQQGEYFADHRKKRVSRLVRYLQSVGAGDEFAAVPKAYGWFEGKDVGSGCNDKAEPTQKVVDLVKVHGYQGKSLSIP